MPTYEYRCRQCAHELEAVQSFNDEPLTTCPVCGGSLRKKFGAPGIAFKGSGFYKTDSRSGNGSSKTSKTSESTSSATKAGGTSGEGSKPSAPSDASSSSSSSSSASSSTTSD